MAETNVIQDLEATTKEILSDLAKSAGNANEEIKIPEAKDEQVTLLKSINEGIASLWNVFKGEGGKKDKHEEPDEDNGPGGEAYNDYDDDNPPDDDEEKKKMEKSMLASMGQVFSALDQNNIQFKKSLEYIVAKLDDQDNKINALANAQLATMNVQKAMTADIGGISEIFHKPQPFQGQFMKMQKSPGNDGLPINPEDGTLRLDLMKYEEQQKWCGENGAAFKAYAAGKISDEQSCAITDHKAVPRNLISILQSFLDK